MNDFSDYLPLSAGPVTDSDTVPPGEYFVRDRKGHVLWYMNDGVLADWICASANGYSVAVSDC